MTTITGIFQPVVAVTLDGTIDVDWGQSWTHTMDEDDIEDYHDDHGTAEMLDARLTAIRELLTMDPGHLPYGQLAELVRPFFITQEAP